jgi:hypothetical protein
MQLPILISLPLGHATAASLAPGLPLVLPLFLLLSLPLLSLLRRARS